MFGSDDEIATQVPTQAQTIVEGSGVVLLSEYRPAPDVDYLQIMPKGCFQVYRRENRSWMVPNGNLIDVVIIYGNNIYLTSFCISWIAFF
ncbi:hypothetical protein L6452_43365 [Arctium lappa]|uniref:Uncharacterized protein n=1 Tax=Arctium lappa TaxID=4217 RepID=A0ACB8XKU1_ARCLA|nr:hypothetical protein L6452_43365 [Arctium lappa]